MISKSKYLAGLQCSKLIWNQVHAKEQFPPISSDVQEIFDQGHLVTGWAQKLFPDGIEVVGGTDDYASLFRQTEEYLKKGKPVFEGAFSYKNAFARPDILAPNQDGSWDLFEVKSSTEVKEINLHDLSFQKYCYEGSGLKIRKANLVTINNQYVRNGHVDVNALFSIEDCTERIRPLVARVESNLEAMLQTLGLQSDPKVPIGKHCFNPYECGLIERCWGFLPEDNIFDLNRVHKEKAFRWIKQGIYKITDIPASVDLSDKHLIQRECVRTGKPYCDKAAIKGFLDSVKFPAYLVDFETYKSPIPPFDGMRPYRQIPFQFSLLVWKGWGTKPEHVSFLWKERADPRPAFMKALKEALGDQGSIFAYNLSFETGRIKEAVESMPQYEDWWLANQSRFQDLLTPFGKFHYYHPSQKGSASIKAVYPAIAGGSYKGLEIADGGAASREYARFMSREISDEEAQKLFKNLDVYCSLDTQAMLDVFVALRRLVS